MTVEPSVIPLHRPGAGSDYPTPPRIPVPRGLPRSPADVRDELLGYLEVLMGHEPGPLDGDGRPLALQEVATAYHTRVRYLETRIMFGELEAREAGKPFPAPWSKIRTGPIQSVLSALRNVMDLGSRRLSELDHLQRERGDAGPLY